MGEFTVEGLVLPVSKVTLILSLLTKPHGHLCTPFFEASALQQTLKSPHFPITIEPTKKREMLFQNPATCTPLRTILKTICLIFSWVFI